MGAPAVVMSDRITGQCLTHQIPTPTGAPSPAGPLPFSAPLVQALATTVLIGGKPAAVQGSWGLNTPPHVGLHASDPHALPNLQRGTLVSGSATVFFDGTPAATTSSSCTMCLEPGQVVSSVTSVLIGA
jgi:uncharacterized Zn-binding protein involved in type VI secretion